MTLFLHGPNGYAIRQQLRQMISAYVAKAGSTLGLERIDGASVRVSDLMAAVAASPFMASSRLVIIEGLVANKAVGAQAEAILAAVPESTVAVFVEGMADQRTKAYRALQKADKVVKYDLVTGPRLHSWIAAEVKRLGGSMERAASEELVLRCGDDQWRLSQEINKLVNFEPQITVAQVRDMVSATVERSIFDLVEKISAGKGADAIAIYGALLRQKEPEIKILVMIQWHLRNLLLAKMAPNMSPQELAKATGMSPYVAGKMMTAQGRVDGQQLAAGYLRAAECEYAIKTGSVRADTAIEQLIWSLASGAFS
jgi:DNA polymerase III subunit delta